jgi:hypothetical protein
MTAEEQKPSEQEKDEASIELLRQLTKKLCSSNISTARLAAFNLSWKQEDGLAILTKTLNGRFSRTTKKAAAYGLRSMKGRMKKLACEVLEQGVNHRDRTTQAACVKALLLMKGGDSKQSSPRRKSRSNRPGIKAVRGRSDRNRGWNRASSRR